MAQIINDRSRADKMAKIILATEHFVQSSFEVLSVARPPDEIERVMESASRHIASFLCEVLCD